MKWSWQDEAKQAELKFKLATTELLSNTAQTEYIRAARRRAGWYWLFSLALLNVSIYIAIIFVLNRFFGVHTGLGVIFSLLLLMPLGFLSKHRVAIKTSKELSKLLLKDAVRPKSCLICQYSLRGSLSASCPECGEPLAPVIE